MTTLGACMLYDILVHVLDDMKCFLKFIQEPLDLELAPHALTAASINP
jgi:hypothetical protein